MIPINEFHDPSYDGLILKLPRWFIEANHLQPELDALKARLEAENIVSKYLPDHQRNKFELNNQDSKKDIGEQTSKRKKEKEEYLRYYEDLLHTNKIYKLTRECTRQFTDHLEFFGERFDDKDVFTKNGIKESFRQLFFSHVKTMDDLRGELKYLNIIATRLIDVDDQIVSMKDINIYQSGIYCFGMVVEALSVNVYERQDRKGNWRYRIFPLHRRKDGSMYYCGFKGNVELDPSLNIRNMHLVPDDFKFRN